MFAAKEFTLLYYMKICCKIQVIIHPLKKTISAINCWSCDIKIYVYEPLTRGFKVFNGV